MDQLTIGILLGGICLLMIIAAYYWFIMRPSKAWGSVNTAAAAVIAAWTPLAAACTASTAAFLSLSVQNASVVTSINQLIIANPASGIPALPAGDNILSAYGYGAGAVNSMLQTFVSTGEPAWPNIQSIVAQMNSTTTLCGGQYGSGTNCNVLGVFTAGSAAIPVADKTAKSQFLAAYQYNTTLKSILSTSQMGIGLWSSVCAQVISASSVSDTVNGRTASYPMVGALPAVWALLTANPTSVAAQLYQNLQTSTASLNTALTTFTTAVTALNSSITSAATVIGVPQS